MDRKLQVSSILLCGLVFSQSAWAYLDPGTGSMMIQGIIAGVTGGIVVIRLYWAKLRSFFAGEPPYKAEADVDLKPDSSDELS